METKNNTAITAEPGKQELVVNREFEAPRELVFEAFTKAEHFEKWMGPCEILDMNLERFEPYSGGSYRFIQSDEDGNSYAFRGVYHEVTAPERIIQTFEFEGLPEPGHVTLETATFESLPGDRTKVILHSVFKSVEGRDGMLQSGAEKGIRDSHSKLDELLEELKSTKLA